jgi:hypothetical protein
MAIRPYIIVWFLFRMTIQEAVENGLEYIAVLSVIKRRQCVREMLLELTNLLAILNHGTDSNS